MKIYPKTLFCFCYNYLSLYGHHDFYSISILKKESKELYVVFSCFLSLYCMFTVISNDNPDKTKTSASVTDSRVQTADIYFKYEIFYTIWLKIIFKKD